MPDEAGETPPFGAGSTVARRDTHGGKIWSATPYRVVGDSGRDLTIACWPGTQMLAPTTWIEWPLTGDDSVRKQAIPNLAAGRWELAPWTWRDTTHQLRGPGGAFRAGIGTREEHASATLLSLPRQSSASSFREVRTRS